MPVSETVTFLFAEELGETLRSNGVSEIMKVNVARVPLAGEAVSIRTSDEEPTMGVVLSICWNLVPGAQEAQCIVFVKEPSDEIPGIRISVEGP